MDQKEFKIDIPQRFFSDVSDSPFENCNICDKYLLENDVPYVVEKAVKIMKGINFHQLFMNLLFVRIAM